MAQSIATIEKIAGKPVKFKKMAGKTVRLKKNGGNKLFFPKKK